WPRFCFVRLVSMLDGGLRTGLVIGDEVVDLTDPLIGLPGAMAALLALGDDASGALVRAQTVGVRRLSMTEARLTAPVPHPPSFLAIARNYDAHIKELGHDRPESQPWFSN